MRNELKVSGLCIVGGILSWVIDVLADPCLQTMPFKVLFLYGSSKHDMFMRSFMFAAFILFGTVSYFIVSRHNDTQEALQKAQGRISRLTNDNLSGILPICSYCKRIRDSVGHWIKIETYIERHSNAEFTHGICPECEKKL